jgi:uncharacterized membrane protein YeaQ/YmgE (transglycosylase-associated protein family)
VIGITGALLGGWMATELFDITTTGGFFNLSTWLIAIAGAVVLLGIDHAITNGSFGSSRRPSRRRARR